MITFLKTFGKGILYFIGLPFLLVFLLLYGIYLFFIFIYISIKSIVLFFMGKNVSLKDELDDKAFLLLRQNANKVNNTLNNEEENKPTIHNTYNVNLISPNLNNDNNLLEDKQNTPLTKEPLDLTKSIDNKEDD